MGKHVTKQPDGRYAVFSTVVDNFVVVAADKREIRTYLFECADLGKRSTGRWIKNADDNPDRWKEDIATITGLREPPEGGHEAAKGVVREALPEHMHQRWIGWIDGIQVYECFDDDGTRWGGGWRLPEDDDLDECAKCGGYIAPGRWLDTHPNTEVCRRCHVMEGNE